MNFHQPRMQPVLTLLVCLFGLILGGALTAAAQGGAVELRGGDETSQAELLMRLVSDGPGSTTLILVGELPEPMPFALPLPPGTRAVGSVSTSQGSAQTYRLVANTDLTPDEVADFYADALAAAPWLPHPGQITGPQGLAGFDYARALYCYGTGGTVQLTAAPLPTGETDLQITIVQEPDSATCAVESTPNPPGDPLLRLPLLKTPDGVEWLDGATASRTSGGGVRSASSSATVRADLSLPDIMAAYSSQLLQNGWEEVMRGGDTNFAWAGWMFSDEEGTPWSASLTITPEPALPDQYHLNLHLQEIKQ